MRIIPIAVTSILLMDCKYALHLARLWFHENPVRIYGLGAKAQEG